LTLLAILIALAYANNLENGFVYDDVALIASNKLLPRIENIPKLFTSDYWYGSRDPYGSIGDSSLYRPLVLTSYALNYAVGGLNPFGYHLINIVLHFVVTSLVFLLALRLNLSRRASIVASILFAVHPIHTEAVTGIVGRAELLMTAGVLAGLWFALTGYRWLSLGAFILALLSKEQSVMLPLLLVLAHLCIDRSLPKTMHPSWTVKMIVTEFGGYCLILMAYLLLRRQVVGGEFIPIPGFLENPAGHVDWHIRLLTAVKVAGRYLWLCLWPSALSADYSYNSIPIPTSILEPAVLWGLISWGSLLAVGWWSFAKGSRRAAFCVGLTTLTFLPVSNIIVPIGTLMGERLFYLPSVGLCLLAGVGWERAESLVGMKRIGQEIVSGARMATIMVTLAASLLIVRTVVRNQDWSSNERLFGSVVNVVPTNAKAHAILAGELKDKSSPTDRERGVQAYRTALQIYPEYLHHDSRVSWSLSTLLYDLGRHAEAFEVLKAAVATDPDWGILHYHLGLLYSLDRQYEKADSEFRRALVLNADVSLFRSTYSRFLLEQGRYEEGLAESESVLQREPDFLLAVFNRALALEALGRFEEARRGFEQVLILPDLPRGAKEDAERRLEVIRSHLRNRRAATMSCMPSVAGC
jgi:hypothetical protein